MTAILVLTVLVLLVQSAWLIQLSASIRELAKTCAEIEASSPSTIRP